MKILNLFKKKSQHDVWDLGKKLEKITRMQVEIVPVNNRGGLAISLKHAENKPFPSETINKAADLIHKYGYRINAYDDRELCFHFEISR